MARDFELSGQLILGRRFPRIWLALASAGSRPGILLRVLTRLAQL
jgi:hypothetical protein